MAERILLKKAQVNNINKQTVTDSMSSHKISSDSINFDVIGSIKSPYKEKFAIPRQPGLVSAAKGKLYLTGAANNIELVRGLEQFSHIWLLFIFHDTQEQGWKPLVRPPRLGGNKKLGVLATRSTFRPNPIGMSAVKLDDITQQGSQVILHISELDLLDGTPIVDIKPYLPYADILPHAVAGFAQNKPSIKQSVIFNTQASDFLSSHGSNYKDLDKLIIQVLEQDPRPAYKQGKLDNKVYGMTLYDLNINWQVIDENIMEVMSIKPI